MRDWRLGSNVPFTVVAYADREPEVIGLMLFTNRARRSDLANGSQVRTLVGVMNFVQGRDCW